jgi:hypothetical protein
MEIFRTELNTNMNNRFDAFVNKILSESLQGGNVSSIPAAMRGIGTTDSNTPPSSNPQITSAQTLPKVTQPKVPNNPNEEKMAPEDDVIKNEIGKLPPDIQQKIAAAKDVNEITSAIANVDPTVKQKIEDYIKNYAASGQNTPAI